MKYNGRILTDAEIAAPGRGYSGWKADRQPVSGERLAAYYRKQDEIEAKNRALLAQFEEPERNRLHALKSARRKQNELLRWKRKISGTLPKIVTEELPKETLETALEAQKARELGARGWKGNRQFLDDCKRETGKGAPAKELNKRRRAREKLNSMTRRIAKKLNAQGINPCRSDSASLWVYWIHSDQFEALPNYRRIMFLPSVAAQIRSTKVAALEYFIQQNPFCRFLTFTNGERCTAAELPRRIRKLHRKISRLSAMLREFYDVEIIFRSTELGTPESAEDKGGEIVFNSLGQPLYHPHAHCILHFRRPTKLDDEEWPEMLKDIWSFWGNIWSEDGRIETPREACKYVTKPGQLLKLTDPQLAELYHATKGLRMVETLGQLRADIKARKEAGLVLRRFHDPKTKETVWRERWNQNRIAKESALAREEVNKIRGLRAHNAEAARIQTVKGKGESFTSPEVYSVCDYTPLESPPEGFCNVMARLSPAIGPQDRKEPRVIVMGSFLDKHGIRNHPLVTRLWGETVKIWEAAISVHTGTPTVPDADDFEFVRELAETFHPPPEPVFSLN